MISNNSMVPFFVPLITFILGTFGGVILERFKNRLIILKKIISTQIVALSSQSPDWGNIEILYNGELSNTLYTSFIEIKNDSLRDLEKLTIEIAVNKGASIYKNSGYLIQHDVYRELSLEEEYSDHFSEVQAQNNDDTIVRNDEEKVEFESEIDYVVRHKKYLTPVLNRNSKITFNLLIDNPHGKPDVTVAIFEKGVTLVSEEDAEQQNKKRTNIVNIIAALLFVSSAYPTIKYSMNINWAVWVMVVNSILIYAVAWPIYLFYSFFKKNVLG